MRQCFFLLMMSIVCMCSPSSLVAQSPNQWEQEGLRRFTTSFPQYNDHKIDIYSGYIFDEDFFVQNNDFTPNYTQSDKNEDRNAIYFSRQNDGERDQFTSTLGKWMRFFANSDFNPLENGANFCEVWRILIDIGSANYKVTYAVIDRCKKDPKIKQFISTKKYKSGLAEDLHNSSNTSLSEETTTNIIATLLRIKEEAKADCQLRACEWAAVATAAMRDAENNQAVAREISRHTGIKVRIISQEEEGFLSYIGARQLIQEKDHLIRNPIVLDCGGRSFQASFIHQEARGPYKNLPIYVYGGNIGTTAYLDFLKRFVVSKLPEHGQDLLPFTTTPESAQNVVQYIMGFSIHMIGFPLPKALVDQLKDLQLFGVSRLHRYSVLPFIDPNGSSFTQKQLTEKLIELVTLTEKEILEKYPSVDRQNPASDIANAFLCLTIMTFLDKEEMTIIPLESSLQSAMVWNQVQWASENYKCPRWTRCLSHDSPSQRQGSKGSCYTSCQKPH